MLRRTTEPAKATVTLPDAKNHLRIEHNDDDSEIQRLIGAATRHVEQLTSRQLITATYTWTTKRFPDSGMPLVFPVAPLASVTSVTYIDVDGNAGQTLSEGTEYAVMLSNDELSEAWEKYEQTWPATRNEPNAVSIVFTAGYGSNPGDVPEDLRQAVLIMVGMLWCDRTNMPRDPAAQGAFDRLVALRRIMDDRITDVEVIK